MQTKMIADMNFTYSKVALKPGDDFLATERDATALRVYKRAHKADGSEVIQPLASGKKTRRYRRRDMTAESA